jgi:seryl-tRNA synthetase
MYSFFKLAQIYFLENDSENQMSHSETNSQLGLIATSEITCAGIFAGEVTNKSLLPKKYACLSHCFRKEAGQGQHSKGLYRLHQFTKVEMFAFTEGDLQKSTAAHQEMLSIQKELYTSLGLHFKILDMPTEELGASAYRKYDIEAYFPSKNGYGEISSTSNCTDYQAMRLGLQYFDTQLEKKLMHTVNGTAVAVPRLMMAILENFQNSKGEVIIPETLRPYAFGLEKIA